MQRFSSSPSCGSSSDTTKRRLSVASILNNEQGSSATPLPATTMGSDSRQRRGGTPKPEHRPLSMPHYPMSSPQYQPQSLPTTTEPTTRFHDPGSAFHQMSPPYVASATNPSSLQVGTSRKSGETEPSGLLQSPDTLDYGPPSMLIFRRAPLTSESRRQELLENDPWSDRSQLTPHSAVCRGCRRTLALDKNRKYYLAHWKQHRSRCTAIQIKKEILGWPQEDGYWDPFATQ